MKLTAKQQRFVDEYLIDLNATQAAIRAGYSEKTAGAIGIENLKKPIIKIAIEERMAEKEEKTIAKQDEVLQFLTSVLRNEVTEQIPLGIGEGAQRLEDKEMAAKDRLKAAELLGKRYGLFTEKLDIKGELGVTIVDDVTDDE